MAALGSISLVSAFVLALYGLVASVAGIRLRLGELILSARNALLGMFGLLTLASLTLAAAFLTHDFSLSYVAEHSSRAMPAVYTIAAFYSGQEGSLLYWSWMLSVFSALVVWLSWKHNRQLMPYVVGVLCAMETFFLLLLAFVQSPFTTLAFHVDDGNGLNPVLQDKGMLIHPPMMLMGYMSWSIPFAFALAALMSGRLDTHWLRSVRRWTLVAFGIQGAGLILGGWWAYHVLGWGGYWGWDPVENVALLPWLVATALLHSLMVQERRGMLRVWNVTLVASAFCLAIFGMFVVGSGVITSVHAFATSSVGPLFFGFLSVSMLGLVALVAYRLPVLRATGQFDALASRESAFLFNNLLLVAVVVATLWGTIFPMVSEVVRGVKMGVGPSFYQQVNAPLLLALVLLMGIGPLLAWRRTSLSSLRRLLTAPVLTALVVWSGLILLGMRQGLAALAFAACALTAVAIGVEYSRGVRARQRGGERLLQAIATLVVRDRRRYGGYLVHLAIVLIGLGIVGSTFQTTSEVSLTAGQPTQVGRYTLTFAGVQPYQGAGYQGVMAGLVVGAGNRQIGALFPDRRVYVHWENQPVTGVAILTSRPWLDDVYVLMTGLADDGTATFRVFVNPLVSLIWAGGFLFLIGGVILFWPPKRARPAWRAVQSGKAIHSEA